MTHLRRRWPAFTLRTLFVVVVIAAIMLWPGLYFWQSFWHELASLVRVIVRSEGMTLVLN
jgi:hypothetical protein